jgi:hypothetical protein
MAPKVLEGDNVVKTESAVGSTVEEPADDASRM